MRRRSYVFYEVRANPADASTCMYRGDEDRCVQFMDGLVPTVDETNQSVYLVRVTLITSYKPGEEHD